MASSKLVDNKLVRDAVHSCALFGQFEKDKIDRIMLQSRLAELEEGQYLIQQGAPATEFFLVIEGEVKLATSSSSGQEKILHIIHPGQTFAEVLMFLGKPRYPASAESLIKSSLVCFPSKLYKDLLGESIDACFDLLGVFAQRNRQLVGEIEALTLYNATFRVIQYLLKEIPSSQLGATSVTLRAPKNVVAARLAITPETLSRIFSRLKQEGVIEVSDKQLILKDLDWLRAFITDA